mmetsp:Transcript_135740/g.434237  ORF Transcript_135740/g.434237 Transcript_135740/m.434237 type:complete len:127 (+) Transcript_135740:339-719(+)
MFVGNGKVSGHDSSCEEKGVHGQAVDGGVSGERTERSIYGDSGCEENGIHGKLVDCGKVSGGGEVDGIYGLGVGMSSSEDELTVLQARRGRTVQAARRVSGRAKKDNHYHEKCWKQHTGWWDTGWR